MAANWESLQPETDPTVDTQLRARFLGSWNEHRRIYGYTLLQELPYALRKALRDHPDLQGLDYNLLIVDEYQDLNACDLEVLKLISGRGCTILAAGDDDQSIYSFRKAAPEGIRRFPQDYGESADYPLSVSQRCGTRIVEWANYVIQGDPYRPERAALRSADGCPCGEVRLLSFPGERTEAEGVAAIVRKLIDAEGIPPSEILILLRTDFNGAFSKPIKERLRNLDVPYSDPDSTEAILGDSQNRRLLAILRLVANRADSLAWASLLFLTDGIGETFCNYIYDRARQVQQQFGQALLVASAENFPGGPVSASTRARSLVGAVVAWLDDHPLPAQGEETKWGNWILQVSGDQVAPAPTAELRTILVALDELIEKDCGLARFVGQIGPLGRDLALAESPGVRIMTMGGAKGLTVRAAVLVALEDGIMPRPDCDLSEERRLLYVGLTRAREFVFGTWARRRRGPTARAGQPSVAIARRHSHFLDNGPVESEDGQTCIRTRWS